jgi:hypothetical protein
MIRCVEVPARASDVVVALARRLEHDADRAGRLNDPQRRPRDANERLWDGLHPEGPEAVYGEHLGRSDARNANVHELAAAAGSW